MLSLCCVIFFPSLNFRPHFVPLSAHIWFTWKNVIVHSYNNRSGYLGRLEHGTCLCVASNWWRAPRSLRRTAERGSHNPYLKLLWKISSSQETKDTTLFIRLFLPSSCPCLGEEHGVGWQLVHSFKPYVCVTSQQETSTTTHELWNLCCLDGWWLVEMMS